MSQTKRQLAGGGIENLQDENEKMEFERLKQLRRQLKDVTDPSGLTTPQLKALVWAIAKHLKILEP